MPIPTGWELRDRRSGPGATAWLFGGGGSERCSLHVVDSVGRLVDTGVRNWAPRVGWEAARLRVSSALRNISASLLTLVFLALLGAGSAAGSDILFALAAAAECLALGCWARSLNRRKRYRAVASRHLGVRVSGRVGENVPRDKLRYEAWCRVNGLTPYAAATDGAARGAQAP